MASNMTKAFQNKSRRALGCRPGYAGGGTTDVFQTGSNSFGDRGAQLMSPGVGGAGVVSASAPLPTVAPSARSAPIYGAGPKQTGFVWEDGTPRVDAQPQALPQQDPFAPAGVGRAPLATRAEMLRGASAQDIAPAGVGRAPIRTLAEQQMAAGHDPNGRYRFDRRSGRQEFYADGGVVKEDPVEALMRRMKQNYGAPTSAPAPQPTPPPAPQPAPQPDPRRAPVDTIRGRNEELRRISNYADGGAVVKEDPVEALLRRTSRNYGVPTSAPAPTPTPQPAPQPAPQPTPQPEQRRTPLDVIRGRNEELKRITNYADGGTVRQVEFHGRGGPREDKIPVRFAGADIRVSDGERGVILPAKTAQNPYAVDAIEDIIQGSNDGRAPRRALGDGGRYADGLDPRTAQGAYENGKWSPEATQFRAQRGLTDPFVVPTPAPTPAPQNIAPDLQIPAEPAAAPAAEAQVRRGLFGRGVDTLRGGGRTIADATVKALGGTPGAAPAEPTPQVATKPAVGKAPTPITDRAKAYGQALGKGEIPGVVKVDAAGNKYLTKGAGAGMGIGLGLQAGDHWDAYDTRPGGLSHGERAQLFARDLGVLAGGTAGATIGGTVGSFVTPIAGTIAGGIAGSVVGGVGADKGMGHLRRGINWANEKLGGAPNYFEDSDTLIARDRASREALGVAEGKIQHSARAVNSTIGSVLQAGSDAVGIGAGEPPRDVRADTSNYSNEGHGYRRANDLVESDRQGRFADQAKIRGIDNALAALTPADIQRQRELAQHTGNAGTVGVEPGGNRIRWQATKGYVPTTQVFEPGTGAATVTGPAANGGRMMPGVKRNALGTSIAIGPGDYLAKDGSRTANWYKTQDYEDAIRRNTQMQVALSQIQNERAGRDPMTSRALGQTMLPPGATAATGAQGSDELLQQALQNLASPDPGTRAYGQHQLAAQNQMITQQMARARMGVEMRSKQAEMANADKASSRSDMERFDKELEGHFRTKGGKDGNEDVADHDAIAEFKKMAAHTVKANLDEAKTPEQRAKWTSAITNKAREAAELDAADRAAMLQQFKVFKRHQQVAGHWLGDSDLGESKRLDYWTPHITKDGEEVYFPKLLKDGKPLRGKAKQYAYTRPITAMRFQRLETPTDDILANAIRDQ